jgi:hypothetical protein
MRLPVPNLEIKIVLPVSLRGGLLNARTVKRLHGNNQAARQQIFPKVSKRIHLFYPVARLLKNAVPVFHARMKYVIHPLLALLSSHRPLASGP